MEIFKIGKHLYPQLDAQKPNIVFHLLEVTRQSDQNPFYFSIFQRQHKSGVEIFLRGVIKYLHK